MSIQIPLDFNVEHIDHGARMGELRIGRTTIETPIAGLNHVDNQYLRKGENVLRATNVQKVPIIEAVYDMKIDEHFRITQQLRNQIIRSLKNRSRRNVSCIANFRINTNYSPNILEFLIETQIEANCSDIITIPDPTLKSFDQNWINSLTRALEISRENLDTRRYIDIMPMVSLNQGKGVLLQKVNWLLGQQINSIGFRMIGQGRKYLKNCIELINNQEEHIWIHLTDVQKDWNGISETHIDTLYGIDTVIKRKAYQYSILFSQNLSTGVNRGLMPTPIGIPIPTNTNQPTIPPIIRDKNIFEADYLGFINPVDYRDDFGDNLHCNCPMCRRARNINTLVRHLQGSAGRGILQVHNQFNSILEFNNLRSSIDDDELALYLNEKRFIQDNFTQFNNRFPNLSEEN